MIVVLSGDRGGFISIKQSYWGAFAHSVSGSCLRSTSSTSFAHVLFPPENKEQFRQSVLASSPRTIFACPGDVGICSCLQEGKEGSSCWHEAAPDLSLFWLPDFPPNTKNDIPIPLSWSTDNPTGFVFKLESKWKLVFHPLLRNITKKWTWKYVKNILYFPSLRMLALVLCKVLLKLNINICWILVLGKKPCWPLWFVWIFFSFKSQRS